MTRIIPIEAKEHRRALIERFEKFILPEPNSGCWLWFGACSSEGYGSFCFLGKTEPAHRVSWILYRGEIPLGAFVLHRCDTPPCVNPAHHFLGDHQTNMTDKCRKGRAASPRGEEQGTAKLTSGQALAIWADSRPFSVIAHEYGISEGPVGLIKAGKLWKHVTGGVPNKRPRPRGERAGGAKLTEELVRLIRAAEGPQHAIGRKFGICQMTVSLVKNRKVWGHVT